jgi:flagellar export protein FliJ
MRSKDTLVRLQRFRFEEKRRHVCEIELMITDFKRKQDELEQQIAIEEGKNGVTDPRHFNYSMTAKSIRARRDNMARSMDDLKAQLAEAQAMFEDAERELRKAELLVEKEGLPAAHAAGPGGEPNLAGAHR